MSNASKTSARVSGDNNSIIGSTASNPLSNDGYSNFVFEVRLKNLIGMPIKKVRLLDLPECTYDALCRKVTSMTYDVPEESINLRDDYEVELRYGNRVDWLIELKPFDNLKAVVVNRYLEQGHVMVSADISPTQRLVRGTVTPRVVVKEEASVVVPSSPSVASILPQTTGSKKSLAKNKKNAIKPIAKAAGYCSAKQAKHSMKIPPAAAVGINDKVKKSKEVDQKILSSLAELSALGIKDVPHIQVAIFSGYTHVKSAGFKTAFNMLRDKKKWISHNRSKKTVKLTEEGIAHVGNLIQPPRTTEEVHARFTKVLKPKECMIFDVLAHGQPVEKEELARRVGFTNPKSGGFSKALSTMNGLEILNYLEHPTNKAIKLVHLNAVVFPFGRPTTSPVAATGTTNVCCQVSDDSSAKVRVKMEH